ncbi:MAG: UMP kinase [Thermoplasmatales archaeon]|nr:UMP kinase [Candidatus Thermoplasmatota archaeon]MDA8055332.1 UMP kinase [Thermoplasmatales archaeon]
MSGPVISLGGSIFSKTDEKYLLEFIKRIKKENEYALVVGGGPIARDEISRLRKIGAKEYYLDMMGIQATRLNATMVSLALGNLMEVPRSIDEAVRQMKLYKRVIMGGTEPGHTTDAVTLLLAEALNKDTVVNVTNVDFLYDRDPRLKDANKIERISYSSAIKMITAEKRGAGENFPLDILSLNIARRSSIRIKLVSFKDTSNVFNAINGKKFKGTLVV